jgi:glycosyltransferase involved in cell wall biosynthesis
MTAWHIITCEYPPQIGGVSHYTRLLARHLRQAGDDVSVWAPAFGAAAEANVHRELGDFSAKALHRADELLDSQRKPRTLLVQWVPHGYGKRGINLGFCRWIASRVRRGDALYLMVHEPCLESCQRLWKYRFVSFMQRRMVRILLHSAARVFISIPGWESRLRDLAPPLQRCEWLPIPATIDAVPDANAVSRIRAAIAQDGLMLGHLGTYSPEIERSLKPSLETVLQRVQNVHVLLLGSNSEKFANELKAGAPELASRIQGAGVLPDGELANHIAACDLMLQPYPDGLSSRRTSLMNVLAQGTPVVSNVGHLSESLWEDSHAVALASTSEPSQLASLCIELLQNEPARRKLGDAGRDLYRSRFDWKNIVATLRLSPESSGHISSKAAAAMAKQE